MSHARICFLQGLPTITSIVEGFGCVSSDKTPLPNDSSFVTRFGLYHHKSPQYESDTMNNA